MKHIDIEGYLEAATQSDEAWNAANDKLIDFEDKLKELTIIKAQIKVLLDNTSSASAHLRSLVADLEKYYTCMCGEFASHFAHDNESNLSIGKGTHAYVNAHDFRSENK